MTQVLSSVASGDVVQRSKERSSDPEANGYERYIGLGRRAVETIQADWDDDGTLDPARTVQFVNGRQAGWQVLAEYADATASGGLQAAHVWGLYIDEAVSTRRDLNADGAFGAWISFWGAGQSHPTSSLNPYFSVLPPCPLCAPR